MNKITKKRIFSLLFAFAMVLSLIPYTSAKANDYSSSGWNQILTSTSVDGAGSVSAGEGVTVLYFSGNRAYIEYSAGNSFRQGFVDKSKLRYSGIYSKSSAGIVRSTTNTFYAPNGSLLAGSVNTGERVAILCEEAGWYYIEYNVSSGKRKRAYAPTSAINAYHNNISYFYHSINLSINLPITSYKNVYAGPDSSGYPVIGSISASDNGKVLKFLSFQDGFGREMQYISYPTSNGRKYGYVYV